MILLDSLYINNAGGKVLLDYLVNKLEERDVSVFYLFDDRCGGDYEFVPSSRKVFLKATLVGRNRFYKERCHSFRKIVCFGNIPPLRRYKDKTVMTYFHQTLFLKLPDTLPFFIKLSYLLKILTIRLLSGNTNFWFVQSAVMKEKLSKRFLIPIEKILLYPFYPPLRWPQNFERAKMSFIYVSNVGPHKNHINLVNEFVRFFDKYGVGSLTLTVDAIYSELFFKINELFIRGYPIYNLGFIERQKLAEIYQRHEYLIFPSLAESFGLGIIEAIENGCKVVASDLPYLHEVCYPSLVFNPHESDSIYKALTYTHFNLLTESKQKIFNQIHNLLIKINE